MELSKAPRKRVDVAVIGSGLAGMLAAITAHDAGRSVMIVAQGEIGRSSNSWLASGGLAAVTGVDPDDSPEQHLADICKTARNLQFDDIAGTFVAEAGGAIRRLKELGVEFHHKDGKLALFPAPGHSRKRSVRCQGGGAVQLMTALIDQARERGIEMVEKTTAIEVLRDPQGGRVAGVACWSKAAGWLVVEACSVILACGGMGQMFPLTSNHDLASGSGYYLALKAGAVLTDLEFVQFTPTSLAYPPEIRGISTGGGLMAQPGVELLNSKSERFMVRYDSERMEASTRDIVSRAIHREVAEGRGTRNNAVYVDIANTDPAAIAHVSGRFLRATARVGIDPYKERVEVAPDVHFAMGGVVADIDGYTGVPGLYAAGEITAGLHGATRLNSNGLTEAAVFGIRAGNAAAVHAADAYPELGEAVLSSCTVQTVVTHDPRRLNGEDRGPLLRTGDHRRPVAGIHIGEGRCLKKEIRDILINGAGIERDDVGIARAVARHEALGDAVAEGIAAADPAEAFVIEGMFVLSRMILQAVAERTESRGAHFRIDWPHQDVRWDKHIAFLSGTELNDIAAGN